MSAHRTAPRASRAPHAHGMRLDPRAPFVVDTRDLGRRAGSMRPLLREVPAPAAWQLPLVQVPGGTPITLDLRLESVMEGVLVTGTAAADVVAECGRCLAPASMSVVGEIQELFGYGPDPEDDEAPVLVGDLVDLEPVVHDAVLLALPLNPVCDEACTGLCPGCGEPFARLEPGHTHQTIDPRWAALANLAGDRPSQPDEEN